MPQNSSETPVARAVFGNLPTVVAISTPRVPAPGIRRNSNSFNKICANFLVLVAVICWSEREFESIPLTWRVNHVGRGQSAFPGRITRCGRISSSFNWCWTRCRTTTFWTPWRRAADADATTIQWRRCGAGIVFQHESVPSLLRELRSNPAPCRPSAPDRVHRQIDTKAAGQPIRTACGFGPNSPEPPHPPVLPTLRPVGVDPGVPAPSQSSPMSSPKTPRYCIRHFRNGKTQQRNRLASTPRQ